MNLTHLTSLLQCHSTPFDEGEVARYLFRHWQSLGLSTQALGRYAIVAHGKISSNKPTLLLTAHMDSPGFTVDKVGHDQIGLIPLGHPRIKKTRTLITLKSSRKNYRACLTQSVEDNQVFSISNRRPLTKLLKLRRPRYLIEHGDRACFFSSPEIDQDWIRSPFLDNRIGCFILLELAHLAQSDILPYNIVLGATSGEEVNGFGARILANYSHPDIAICLDTTYCNQEQGVSLKLGPALTLSDASVILAPQIRDHFKSFFKRHNLPLQTEVYNYSGTDAKAFPSLGLTTATIALLVPSLNNHSSQETIAVQDLESTLQALKALIIHGEDLFNEAFSFSLEKN